MISKKGVRFLPIPKSEVQFLVFLYTFVLDCCELYALRWFIWITEMLGSKVSIKNTDLGYISWIDLVIFVRRKIFRMFRIYF